MSEINSITYKEFISQFPIYPSRKEAKAKGFEAHHVVPVCAQDCESRKEIKDDRCVRLTAYEHVLAHYLYCKENPDNKDALYAFAKITDLRNYKLSEFEKLTLESLKEYGELRKKGCSNRKGTTHTEEAKEKNRLAHIGRRFHQPQSAKDKISKARKGIKFPETQIEKIRQGSMGNNNAGKSVTQYSLNNDYITTYKSAAEATRQTGCNYMDICNCIKGRVESCGGYIWKRS